MKNTPDTMISFHLIRNWKTFKSVLVLTVDPSSSNTNTFMFVWTWMKD